MIRVLHVAEALPGGIGAYLREMLPYQVGQLGPQAVHVLVPAAHVGELPPLVALQCWTYRRRGRDPRSIVSLMLAVLTALRRLHPDVVHAHSTFAGVAVRAVCLLFLKKRPRIVYCAHGWSFLREVEPWKNWVLAAIERALAPLCDAIVCISRHEYEAALRAGIGPALCHVVRSGVSPPRNVPRIELALDPQRLNLLFVGRHDAQKGLAHLLDTFRRLPQEKYALYVAGAAVVDGDARTEFPAAPNIHWLGWINHAFIDGLYPQFDALIVPSRWEGFGLVVLEAMRNSVAVIASDRGALPEIVEDGASGRIFELDRSDGLFEVLNALDKSELQRMGRCGERRFRAEFTASRMNADILELYRQIGAGYLPT
ncbi:MAG: glycosyltransferase family 4 protein [Gammaproteobacteria bacterium]|nr:glycosyltransferase family 4 protein [Gammaproteobacteria bacterium]